MEDKADDIFKWTIIAAAGCVVMFVCFAAGGLSAVGGIVWLSELPDDIDVTIHTPDEVEVGEWVLIDVKITNKSGEAARLSSIDLSTGYLEGIDVPRSTPAFDSTDTFESYGIEYQTFYFEQEVPAGEALTVTLEGKAVAAGNHAGEIDVCIGAGFKCFNNILRTFVR
jgi:hypothetical protein